MAQQIFYGECRAGTVFAVIFFLIFFLLNNFGKKFVKQDVLQPVVGIWLPAMVLLPIGFFLIAKARNDSQLLNKEFYYRVFRKILPAIRKLRGTKKQSPDEPVPANLPDEGI
jgi:lipopolysaccharide export system permease protein